MKLLFLLFILGFVAKVFCFVHDHVKEQIALLNNLKLIYLNYIFII